MIDYTPQQIRYELARRLNFNRQVALLDLKFKHQNDFILDPAKLKAAWCTRRSAKSYTGGLYLIKECLENPGVSCLYIALTRLSAKGIIWKDILKIINQKHNLGIKFNESELTATFPNGSIIYVTGVDADEDEMTKLLGKKYKLVVLDEASLYSVNLRQLIYGILKPAVADYRGTICLLGTSSNVTRGLFFDITNKNEPGWSIHQWTAFDNPYIRKQWQEELDDIAQTRPLFMQTPLFKQWYLNQWVIDETKLVYKYSAKNLFRNFDPNRSKWTFILGVDLGYNPDPSAFVVCAFNRHEKLLYIVESSKQTGLDITAVAERIASLGKKYDFLRVIIDNANVQAVEEIRRRHGIALTAADKTGKADFIEIMNSEFIQDKIKVQDTCTDLITEYQSLVWQEDGGEIKFPRKEHPSMPNHCSDAALYAWRYCYQYLSEAKAKPVTIDTQDKWIEHSKKLQDEELEKQIERQKAEADGNDYHNIIEMGFEDNPLDYYVNKKRGRL